MVDVYSRDAQRYFERYQSLAFEDVHRAWLDHLPEKPGFVLDVGAGSGRDALALARQGWDVLAVEPADGLRELGMAATAGADVQWLDDRLPELSRVRALSYRFDLILISAVWMHLRPGQRERAFRVLAEVLAPGGLLIITLRHGPSDRDRNFFDCDSDELEALARRRALVTVHIARDEDRLHRGDVSWESMVFRLPDDGTGSLPLVRHIIVNDDKASTYKLGLLRAITRIADGVPGMVLKRTDDYVEIPLGLVGLYWIKLYQPLILRHHLRQLPGRANYAFAGDDFLRLADISSLDLRVGRRLDRDLAVVLQGALRKACQTIAKMPAHYITHPGTNRQVFDARVLRSRILQQPVIVDRGFLSRFGTFRVPAPLWDCCSRYACWIEPAIVNEWAALMQSYEVRYDNQIYLTALRWEEGRRETGLARGLVDGFLNGGRGVSCVWSNTRLSAANYQIDHCFPWSRWMNNDLWNLMPASSRANAAKAEKLPAAPLLQTSRARILQWWAEAFVGSLREQQFFIEAEAALPMAGSDRNLAAVFEGVVHQRMRLKMNQQLAEWYGLPGVQ